MEILTFYLYDWTYFTKWSIDQFICLSLQIRIDFPAISLWAMIDKQRIAHTHLPSSRLHYSSITEDRGQDCSQLVNLSFERSKNSPNSSSTQTIGTIELYLWFGKIHFIDACWNAVLPGYDELSNESHCILPKYLEYNESSVSIQ